MNDLLQFLKDGSGIHIKKSQRGSFTKYCNGKVTNECIQRGKNSSNPKIRKKAVFADNSRKWRHQQGGVLQTFGGGGITDSLIDFVIQKEGFNETPTDIGDGKITIGSGLTAKKWIDLYNQKGVWSKEDNRAAVIEELQNRLKAWQQAYSGLGQAADQKAKYLRMIDNQEIADKTNNIMNGIVQSGLGALGNYLSNNTPMKQINKFNQNYINNYQSVTAPQNYMKSIKELGNFQIK